MSRVPFLNLEVRILSLERVSHFKFAIGLQIDHGEY